MKKTLIFLLVMLLMVVLVGCNGADTEVEQEPVDTDTEGAPEPTDEAAGDSEIIIVTEDYPPLNYLDEDGNIAGTATEMVRAALGQLDWDAEIQLFPWARTYDMALEQENVFIYSITRTEEREDLFKWVAPVAYENVYLYKLKDRDDLNINALDDAKDYMIATVADYFTEQGLISHGFAIDENLNSVPDQSMSISQLFEGRADFWIGGAEGDVLEQIVSDAGYDVNDIEVALLVEEMSATLYIAANINTADELVQQLRDAMPAVN